MTCRITSRTPRFAGLRWYVISTVPAVLIFLALHPSENLQHTSLHQMKPKLMCFILDLDHLGFNLAATNKTNILLESRCDPLFPETR